MVIFYAERCLECILRGYIGGENCKKLPSARWGQMSCWRRPWAWRGWTCAPAGCRSRPSSSSWTFRNTQQNMKNMKLFKYILQEMWKKQLLKLNAYIKKEKNTLIIYIFGYMYYVVCVAQAIIVFTIHTCWEIPELKNSSWAFPLESSWIWGKNSLDFFSTKKT